MTKSTFESSSNRTELLDRYLQAVRFWLPKAQQQDIIAELQEDLRSQIEEQENGLGRSLNESEIETILKQRGRPFIVANRYLPQGSLIGPVLFPIYVFVMKVVALCYLVPWVLVWIGMISFSSSYRAQHISAGWFIAIASAWSALWSTAFMALATVTVVFAAPRAAAGQVPFPRPMESPQAAAGAQSQPHFPHRLSHRGRGQPGVRLLVDPPDVVPGHS